MIAAIIALAAVFAIGAYIDHRRNKAFRDYARRHFGDE